MLTLQNSKNTAHHGSVDAMGDESSLESQVFSEQIHFLYLSMVYSLKVAVCMVFLAVVVCQIWMGWRITLAWGLIFLAVYGWRFYSLLEYKKEVIGTGVGLPMTPAQSQRWAKRGMVGAGTTGSLWGLASVIFFPVNQIEYQVFLILLMIGISTGAAFAQSPYMPALSLFLAGVIVPLSAVVMYQTGSLHHILGAMCVLYAIVLHRMASIANQRLLEGFRLRLKTQSLAKQLSQQVLRADEANLAKSQFLAAASHDLRQPLHAMELFASALDYHDMDSSARNVVAKLGKSIASMRGLLDALMDISRLDAGVVKSNISPVSLHRLIDGVAEEFVPVASEKGLRLSYRCPTGAVTLSDAVLLRSILMNLVSNAVRYTRAGRILITCRPHAEFWQVAVYDTGQGIPEDQQERVFNEFIQLGISEQERHSGLGLGLAIIKRQVALLGHSLSLRSQVGRGSCFAVLVPQTQAEVTDAVKNSTLPHRFGAKRCVVVVDDDQGVLDAMTLLLESWGFQVSAAASAELATAAQKAKQQQPVLLLCDWRLGGDTDGMQAIADLRESFNNHKLPAALITAESDVLLLSQVEHSGIPLLSKPVRAEDLYRQVTLLLGSR